MTQTIVTLPGDGIGPEVIAGAVKILHWCNHRHGLELEVESYPAGGVAIEQYGDPLPDFVMAACKEADAILVGAAGGPKFDGNLPRQRPEQALLRLRSELQLYANLRPITSYPPIFNVSPLKESVLKDVDIMIVRELTGGIYFGKPRGASLGAKGRFAYNSEVYHDYEIERIARVAFQLSQKRSCHVTNVDKSNILESSQLWRTVVEEVSREYPDVKLDHMLVDNCSMQLILHPRCFDVLLSTNMFGDILSDEAALLTGSIGMLPSASLGDPLNGKCIGLYEPVHGSAPDIAGLGRANPIGAISSVALLFKYSLCREDISVQIDLAVQKTLARGYRTEDLVLEGEKFVGTEEMTDQVLKALKD